MKCILNFESILISSQKNSVSFSNGVGAEKGIRTLTSFAHYPLKIACLPVPPFLHKSDFKKSVINLIYPEILYIPFSLQMDMLHIHLMQFLLKFQVMHFQLHTLLEPPRQKVQCFLLPQAQCH